MLCLAVCIAHDGITETKTVRAVALAGLNRMFVQRLQALLEELDQATQPTAWFQCPQACGARLSEREQMVTWIVQQVPSTPAHCLACCTLPQQTPLIIDVLEWPHHHWILPSGRIIKVITATLTYCNEKVWDFYKRNGLLETSWDCTDLSVSV